MRTWPVSTLGEEYTKATQTPALESNTGINLANAICTIAPEIMKYWKYGTRSSVPESQELKGSEVKHDQAWVASLLHQEDSIDAYIGMRSYYLYVAYGRRSDIEVEHKNIVSPRDFITKVAASICEHVTRKLVVLPPRAQSYLQYVWWILMNYIHRDEPELLASDCTHGDAIFAPVSSGSSLVFVQTEGPLSVVLKDTTTEYLERAPTDAEVLARLVSL